MSFKRLTGSAKFEAELHRLLMSCQYGVNPRTDPDLVSGCRLTPFQGPIHGLSRAELVTGAKGTKLVLTDEAGNTEDVLLRGQGTEESPFRSVRANNVLAECLRQEPSIREAYRARGGAFKAWQRANDRRERAVSSRDDIPFTPQSQGIPLEKEESRRPHKGFSRW